MILVFHQIMEQMDQHQVDGLLVVVLVVVILLLIQILNQVVQVVVDLV